MKYIGTAMAKKQQEGPLPKEKKKQQEGPLPKENLFILWWMKVDSDNTPITKFSCGLAVKFIYKKIIF